MISEKKESKSRASLIGPPGTGSSRLFSYNTHICVNRPIYFDDTWCRIGEHNMN